MKTRVSAIAFLIVLLTAALGLLFITIPAAEAACGSPDSTKPTVSVGSPEDESTSTFARVEFTGQASDNCEVDWVKVKIYDANTMKVISNYADAGDVSESEQNLYSQWRYEYTFAEAGEYLIKVKAQDLSGKFAHAEFTITLDIPECGSDMVDPRVAAGEDDVHQSTTFSYILVGQANDNCAIEWVKVKIYKYPSMAIVSQYQHAFDFSEPESQPFSTWLYDYTFPTEGQYLLQAKVRDTSGNDDWDDMILTVELS